MRTILASEGRLEMGRRGSTKALRAGAHDRPAEDQSAVHGVGLHFAPLGSFRKSVLVMNS
jgi:hypothetical protein